MMRHRWPLGIVLALCLVAVAAFAGMSANAGGRSSEVASAEDCGLPPPDAKLSSTRVPGFARIPGRQIVAADEAGGRVFGSLNVPLAVADLRDVIRSQIESGIYDVLYEDFEGFEAEIFIERNGDAGIIRMARSRCDEMSSLSFQIPNTTDG